jgi:hypothetical protein
MKRHVTSRLVAAVAVFAAVLLALSAQPRGGRAADENPAKELVKLSVKAAGGPSNAASWTTRIDKGHLKANWPGWGELNATYARWIKKPDKMKIDQDFTAYDHPFFFTYYINQGDVWSVVNLGVRQNDRLTKRMSKTMRAIDGLAYYLAECDTFYTVASVADDSLVAASRIDRVGVVDQGDTVVFDLDKKTHLPVRRIEDRGATHVLFDDYRKVNGLEMPYRMTVHQADGRIEEYVFEEFQFGGQIDDAVFEESRPKKKE